MKSSLLLLSLIVFSSSVVGQLAKLTGSAYDANGSVIVGAEETAISSDGKIFRTRTNEEGTYEFRLPFNKYEPSVSGFKISTFDIEVSASGFQRTKVTNLKFVRGHTGKMTFDFALDVAVISDPVEVTKPNQ